MALTWSDVGKTVAKAAPVLGAVLGGPVGAVVASAGALAASALGTEPEPEAVEAALKASPEALLKLKELEGQQQARLLDWQTAQLNAELANVQGARDREVDLAKSGSKISWSTSIVSTIVTVGFFAVFFAVLKLGRDPLGDAGLVLIGALANNFNAVINYYLGSSAGSALKEQYKNWRTK